MNVALVDRLQALAATLVSAGWSHFVQVLVLAVLLGLIDLAVGRRIGAPWRCALWLIFFVKLVLPPHLALPSSPIYWWHHRDPAPIQTMMPTPASVVTDWNVQTEPAAHTGAGKTTPAASRPTMPARLSWQLFVIAGWTVGVLGMAGATWIGRRRFRRMLERSAAAPEDLQDLLARIREQVGVRGKVALRLTEASVGPLVVGLRRPTVYLPRSLVTRLTPEQLHSVLVHELSHVKRGDLWVSAVQTAARVVFFYHPAVWWVNTHVARLREEATDQAVLAHRDVDAHAYSLALVTAAEAMLSPARSAASFALGVVETKTQLRKRITMNLSHPRPSRVSLSGAGLCSLALLALVLVPMAPAGASDTVTAPAGFKASDPDPTERQVDAATAKIIAAFNRHDRDAYIATFTPDSVMLPPGSPLISGHIGISQSYMQLPPALMYEGMKWKTRDFYQVGAWTIEAGLVDFQYRLSPEAPVMAEPRSVLTVWQQDRDKELRPKVLAWSRTESLEQVAGRKPQAFACAAPGAPFAAGRDFSAVLAAEDAFHRALEERQVEKAASFYHEQATLLGVQTQPVRGRADIQRLIEATPPEHAAKRIERQAVLVEGNENYALVVNVFRWSFAPAGTDVLTAVSGKGVHLWQRGNDGAWRILFDLPNASQPVSG